MLAVATDALRGPKPVILVSCVAVLLAPLDDDDLESILIARSPCFQALLEQSRQSIQAGKGLPEAEFWKATEERLSS